MALEPTLIGRVRHVMGAVVTAELAEDIAGTSPIYKGRVYQIGQIGSIVRLPQGSVELIGSVTMLGIAELVPATAPAIVPQQGDRWIQFQLLGEIGGLGKFERGVSTYPSIDDPVHFATREHIEAIFPAVAPGLVRLGTLSASRGEPVHLDLGRLVMRHSAIVGSTGSGKSSTVARMLQSIVAAEYKRANIVVIDVHGEYASALPNDSQVLSVGGDKQQSLHVPYWALSLDDLLQVYAPGLNPNVRNRIQELVLDEKRSFLEKARWSSPAVGDITVDSPVPFDLRKVWYELDYENRATYRDGKSKGEVCVTKEGNATTLDPVQFEHYSLGAAGPFQGNRYGHYNPAPDRIRTKLLDPRFEFLCHEWPNNGAPDPLPSIMSRWLGDKETISILDFSGVPSEAAVIAIGAVLNLLFVAASSSGDEDGVGRARPILVVLEEAHRFLGEKKGEGPALARTAAEQISREGRKHGIGLMVVSQRPSELSETALSQCGTVISMRLTNSSDQGRVKAALPDAVAGLVDALAALRTGEALVTGEAVALPARVNVDRPSPEPRADDPSVGSWIGNPKVNSVTRAIARWRGDTQPEDE